MKWLSLLATGCIILIALAIPAPIILPDSALRVDMTHLGKQTIDLLEFRHGNLNTQESIIALNIRPGEQRAWVLNHEAGAGFNLILLSGGKRTEVCIGKHERARHYKLTLLDGGDFRFVRVRPSSGLGYLLEFLKS